MPRKIATYQSGFSLIIVILAAAVISTVGTISYVRVKQAQNDKKASEAQKVAKTADAAIKANNAKTKKEAVKPLETPVAEPTPAPVATAPAKAVIKSAPAEWAPAAYTGANCTGNSTVYVSNKNGTTSSYHPGGQGDIVKSYAYKEAILIFCQVAEGGSAPAYVYDNDAGIKTSDVSPTKP